MMVTDAIVIAICAVNLGIAIAQGNWTAACGWGAAGFAHARLWMRFMWSEWEARERSNG